MPLGECQYGMGFFTTNICGEMKRGWEIETETETERVNSQMETEGVNSRIESDYLIGGYDVSE